MISYKFNKALVRNTEIAENLSIPEGTIDYWKYKWKKDGHDTYDMGLRLIGNKAYWDPIQLVNWIAQNKLNNKPKQPEQILDQTKLIAFVTSNVKIEKGRS